MDQDPQAELRRLRARVQELESLEHRVAYVHAMALQLRTQTNSIVDSRAWRLLTRFGGLWLRLAGKKPVWPVGPWIPPEQYHRWIAECEHREVPVGEKGPLFSVVSQDSRTLASLQRQTYKSWEAVASTAEARGDYVVAPGAGDELAPDALYLFARAAAQSAAVIYCDEDRLDERNLRVDPWFKPDWSPDLMAQRDYIGKAVAVQRALAREQDWQGGGGEGHVVHIPRVLYHASTARPSGRREPQYSMPGGIEVEVLIPTCNAKLLARCLESLACHTARPAYRVTVIDNSSGEEVAQLVERHGARYVDWKRRSFNYSAMNNAAVEGLAGNPILFLNDDITASHPGWLQALVEQAVRPEVGAVGARLLYPNGQIQHAGVTIGIFGVCGHAFKSWPGDLPTYAGLGETVRNVSAVTGACLMVRPETFRAVGGFDAIRFPVAYNDIDLCLRIGETGKRIVYTPHATLYHHEARSKSWSQRDPALSEIRAFQTRWLRYIENDPYYNPNLTRANESYTLRSGNEWA